MHLLSLLVHRLLDRLCLFVVDVLVIVVVVVVVVVLVLRVVVGVVVELFYSFKRILLLGGLNHAHAIWPR